MKAGPILGWLRLPRAGEWGFGPGAFTLPPRGSMYTHLYCSTEYKYCTTTHFALSCSCSVCTSVTQGTAPTPALNGHETRGGGVMRTSRGLWRASRTFRGLYALCRIARYPRIDAAVGPSPRDDGRSAVAGLLARRSDRRSRRRRWTLSSALDVGRGRVES